MSGPQAHSVPLERVSLLRSPLVHFLLVGALFYGLQSALSPVSEPIVVEVLQSEIDQRIKAYRMQLGREPSPSEARSIESQVVENALWLEQARAQDELFRKAIALGMDESDTVVRRRLIDRVQAMIRAGVRSRTPDDSVLRAHYAKNAERWRQSALLDLSHVYFSRDQRGNGAKIDAASVRAELVDQEIVPETAVALGDPFLSGHRLRAATPNQIVARFGPAFAAVVEHEAVLRWTGPIESAFGSHLVWIHARTESRIAGFGEVRKRVLEDWITEETRAALRAQIERRRRVVEVRVIDDRNRAQEETPRDEDAPSQAPI